jgi:glycosyltransferase involved in cell wall biosynthesis
VRVVARQTDPELCRYDRELMESRSWPLETIELVRNGSSHQNWFKETLNSKLSKTIFDIGICKGALAPRAYVRGMNRLADLATSKPADWFVAHTQAALPAAAVAAKRWNSRLGFDCEDLLSEMGNDPSELVKAIEQTYLSLCDYVSVPSQSIGKRLIEQFDIQEPTILYNVFPTTLANKLKHPADRELGGPLKLHWFGQTIGTGRGLEQVIAAAKLLDHEIEFHLRGRVADSYRCGLQSSTNGSRVRLIFHPLIPHDKLINSLDQFHVGVASEVAENEGNSRTVSNKIFSYLLAGLAVAGSATTGQREVLADVPATGFLYSNGCVRELAQGLQKWLTNREALREAQAESWRVSRERFCWDVERLKLLRLFGVNQPAQLA